MSRYKAYPVYRDSGVEWVGEIPKSWQVTPLFSVASTGVEKNDDGAESNVLSLSYGRIIRRDVEDNHGLLPESFNTYQIVDSGDIILRLTDLQNDKRSLRVGMANEKGIITSAYLKLTAKAQFLDRYLYRLLHSYDTTKVFYGMGGGLRQSMKFEEMRRLQMLCPSLDEQKQIAAFLDHETAKIDALIEKQQRLIELLKEKRQAVISHAVTKGLNPNAPMKDSGVEWLGEVPAHWGATQLKYATLMIVDCPHETPIYSEEGRYLVIRTADLDEGRLDTSKMYRVDEDEYLSRIRRAPLCQGDIVYGREGERWGHAGLVPEDHQYCLGQRMMQFRANSLFCPDFLMWLLNSDNVYKQGQVDTVGATSPHVNVGTIRNFSLTQPPLSEQQEISQFLNDKACRLDALIDKALNTISLLQERRTALISAAVTGKIDVRDWQPAAA